MVSIIIPENSPVDLINAGMSLRHYTKKGDSLSINILNENDKEKFWNNIKKYIDEKDHTLLILNFPLPSEEILKNLKIEPYEYSILYIPSKFISVTPQIKKILLEKGIVSMPQREPYKCFPGEYIDEMEKKWIEIGKRISLKNDLDEKPAKHNKIINGILKKMEENPMQVVKKIANDDTDFFIEASQSELPEVLKHIKKTDLEIISTKGKRPELVRLAVIHFLDCKKPLIGVKGVDSSLILTNAPTFAQFIIDDAKINTEVRWKFGGGAAMFIKTVEDTDIDFLLGRLSQKKLFIKFGSPKNVVKKTLRRRLLGGKGPKGRVYRGVKDIFPNIEIIQNIISLPRDAIEYVTDIFKETGTEFELFI